MESILKFEPRGGLDFETRTWVRSTYLSHLCEDVTDNG